MNKHNFSHLDADGDINMVDVGTKTPSRREAIASARVVFPTAVYQALRDCDGQTKKGSITATAHLAGIMAAKQTSNLIPLCHALPLEKVALNFYYDDEHHALIIKASAVCTHKTGVEMEALTAASVAALTIYDMTKAMSHDIVIEQIQLEAKSGGKHDFNRNI